MINLGPFGRRDKSVIGVDIGTSAIRLVELSRHGQQEKLENYAKMSFPIRERRGSTVSMDDRFFFSTKRMADMLKELINDSRVESSSVNFSLPDFSTLFTTFTIPSMKRDEVPQAVRFEARQRVPLPISEVTLDWIVVGGEYAPRSTDPLEVLLVVVPNRVIDRYVKIADLCGLKLDGLEAEVFALQRALLRGMIGTFGLIDIGLQSTTVSIVDNDTLRTSYSFDLGGGDLTHRVVKGMSLSERDASVIKQNRGLDGPMIELLGPTIDKMVKEIRKVTDRFYEQKGRDVSRYYLAGATATMPGLTEYLREKLGKDVVISLPFEGMVYPPIIEDDLIRISPEFTIATGIALKGITEE